MPDLRSVPDPSPPKLVEQLKLLRDEWGEGFDEDIAQPLADLVLTLRTQHKASHQDIVREIEEGDEERDRLSQRIDEIEGQDYDGLIADLEDMRRGVRSVEELYDKWL